MVNMASGIARVRRLSPMTATAFVEASNVINVPKCNKGPKGNNSWP